MGTLTAAPKTWPRAMESDTGGVGTTGAGARVPPPKKKRPRATITRADSAERSRVSMRVFTGSSRITSGVLVVRGETL